jgi:hypothetical protein
MGEAFKTACTRIEARPTGTLEMNRRHNSCLPPAVTFRRA